MESAETSKPTNSRNLRKKTRKIYRDDGIDDDEIDGMQLFDLEEKINRIMPAEKFYLELSGSDLTLKYFQKHGFTTPILIKDKSGLGLRPPQKSTGLQIIQNASFQNRKLPFIGWYYHEGHPLLKNLPQSQHVYNLFVDKLDETYITSTTGNNGDKRSSRVLDVMDVSTQKDLDMTLKEWVKYYENPEREKLLNVISLEFSHTKLENYVDQPEVVHQMDWVDLVWPCFLKEFYPDPVTGHGKMLYPKVQKYCLMSVGGCYTDFHIDMGGTSVWYHILRGKKIFWLIPPTEENLVSYENWTLSGRQGDVFFGDIVNQCYRITLEAGFTFFIPTGWIHAVYTPEDSLVFGGNFLHCFNIKLQLRVWEVEVKTRVPAKFRYPLFAEIHWYVIERYVSCLLGRSYRQKFTDDDEESAFEAALRDRLEEKCDSLDDQSSNGDSTTQSDNGCTPTSNVNGDAVRLNIFDMMSGILTTNTPKSEPGESTEQTDSCSTKPTNTPSDTSRESGLQAHSSTVRSARVKSGKGSHRNIARYELDGLTEIVKWLENLPAQKKNVPKDIENADLLLADMKFLLDSHSGDDHDLAVTGKSIIKQIQPKIEKPKKKQVVHHHHQTQIVHQQSSSTHQAQPKSARMTNRADSTGAAWKYRRVRCKQCEPCTRADCRECYFCKDMIKYGGAGKVKQTCISRQCLGTVLPASAVCDICRSARCSDITITRGAHHVPATIHPTYDNSYDGEMMECRICFEVIHPACQRVECWEVELKELTHSGIVDEDLPSSWECGRCCSEGKAGTGKHRQLKPTYNPRPIKAKVNNESSGSSDEETDSLVDKPVTNYSQQVVIGSAEVVNDQRTRTRSDDEDSQSGSSKMMKLSPVIRVESLSRSPDESSAYATPSINQQLYYLQQQRLQQQQQLQQQQLLLQQEHLQQPQLQQQQFHQQHLMQQQHLHHPQLQQQQQQLHQQQLHQLQQHQLHQQHLSLMNGQMTSPGAWVAPGFIPGGPRPEDVPTRVNSRGREISTPRRYLL